MPLVQELATKGSAAFVQQPFRDFGEQVLSLRARMHDALLLAAREVQVKPVQSKCVSPGLRPIHMRERSFSAWRAVEGQKPFFPEPRIEVDGAIECREPMV